ncbi:DUF2384 domain-containing protein [Kineobactrum salinum]|uniref:DUF2384 domain-containing protein n=1 Tax=Kineobactrum salinum TaxID=2708301 RepID=A0A6C0U636_9GAMM|nr:DUF2384 domain-containing protein [Kineobactrum salinum]
MVEAAIHSQDDARILADAVISAASKLGLDKEDVGRIVGRNRTTIGRNGISPDSKAGELGLLFIRIYRSLYALMGGDLENMRHFMRTKNTMTGGIPAQQVMSVQGLVRVCDFLDAMRGRG